MNKAKHRLLTPNELAEQRKEQIQAATAKMVAAQKKRAEAAAQTEGQAETQAEATPAKDA